ncbi:MAG: tRNA threonylcarbamoyladenosine dehydratase [Acetobacter sp.]|nr:tRNA threonylcarbamoyladenosine dehydratase [Acetobacter sp.]
MLNERLKRTIALLGEEKAEKIRCSSVMVIGCGAVGGYALEMIARLGFGKIWVVDFDVFEESNLNRQILATIQIIGRKKCDVAKERVLAINPEAEVVALDLKVAADNLDFILEANPDFVIDAIDDVMAKAALIKFLADNDIRAVSAMGAALKTKPEMLRVARLDKTEGCHLAKKLRDMLRRQMCDLKKVRCVYSAETVKICKDEAGNNILGSLPMVPAAMGIMLATEIFKLCCDEN